MMESKAKSIRADEKTHERFKAIAEDFSNQGEALESLINTYELQKAKGAITNMQTDIEDFDVYLRGIQKSYLHVLELNQNTENRARLEFQQQLESKERQIADLQQRVDAAELACTILG
jgi:predicted  nucleic acid-binding Zn-ribbon protein